MEAYTNLEQSKKLAEILPLESADMLFQLGEDKYADSIKVPLTKKHWEQMMPDINPCWSLAALLHVLPKEIEIDGQHYAPCLFPVQDKWLLKLWYNSNYTITSPIAIFSDNPIDAAFEMVVWLSENKLLNKQRFKQ